MKPEDISGVDFESMGDESGPLNGKTVILGIAGGIAAYKACDLASKLRKAGADVHAETVAALLYQSQEAPREGPEALLL